ncbi:MAG TPA: hypothetical protein PLK76_04150 [bacterium]|nr:hypothetical protein [bacterium]
MFNSLYFKDKFIRWGLISSFFLNLFLWVILYRKIPIQVEPIVLRYNIYVGINLIGSWWQVFYLPLIGLAILIFNFLLAKMMFLKEKFLARLIAMMTIIAQIFLMMIGILLTIING